MIPTRLMLVRASSEMAQTRADAARQWSAPLARAVDDFAGWRFNRVPLVGAQMVLASW